MSKNDNIASMTTLVSESFFEQTGTRHWYALYTASNHEKAVERNLKLKEVEVFLPLHVVTKRWKNRTTAKVHLPLFAGYVFVKIPFKDLGKVLSVPRVYSIVGTGKDPIPLPDGEIETLRSGLKAGDAKPWSHPVIGAKARIVNGPLSGLQGVVVRHDGQLRVVLTVDLIAKSITVHVNAEDLEIDESIENSVVSTVR